MAEGYDKEWCSTYMSFKKRAEVARDLRVKHHLLEQGKRLASALRPLSARRLVSEPTSDATSHSDSGASSKRKRRWSPSFGEARKMSHKTNYGALQVSLSLSHLLRGMFTSTILLARAVEQVHLTSPWYSAKISKSPYHQLWFRPWASSESGTDDVCNSADCLHAGGVSGGIRPALSLSP